MRSRLAIALWVTFMGTALLAFPAAHAQDASTVTAANETNAPLSPDAPPATPETDKKASWWSNFRDPKDGALDMSRWLLQHNGALLVPIIITEPAVGNGGGLAAVFFHAPKQSDESKESGQRLPPDIYGVAAFKTENGTWGYGAGGS